MSDNNSNVVKNPTISAADAEKLMAAIATMFPLVKYWGKTLDGCDSVADANVICFRAIKALQEKESEETKAFERSCRAAVEAVIRDAVKEGKKTREDYEALLPTLPENLRAVVSANPPPDAVYIPLSDFADCFPTGCDKSRMVSVLHSLNYTLARGRQEDGEPKVRIPLTPKVVPVPPSRRESNAA
jgi:hypothetical protein